MKKYRVKNITIRYNGKIYKKNEVLEMDETTGERFVKSGYVEVSDFESFEMTPEEKDEKSEMELELKSKTVNELKEFAESKGIEILSVKKDGIIGEILKALSEIEEEKEDGEE